MVQIAIDDVLRDQLDGLTQPIELCDASGRVVARVTPVDVSSDVEFLNPEVDEAELVRRMTADEKQYTTDEVIRHLDSASTRGR